MVSIVDQLGDGFPRSTLSTIPTPPRELRHYNILWQIEQCRRARLPYLYLGYWIRDSRKMSTRRIFSRSKASSTEPGGNSRRRDPFLIRAPDRVAVKWRMLYRALRRCSSRSIGESARAEPEILDVLARLGMASSRQFRAAHAGAGDGAGISEPRGLAAGWTRTESTSTVSLRSVRFPRDRSGDPACAARQPPPRSSACLKPKR